MQVAFYKGSKNDGFFSKLIRWWTRPKFWSMKLGRYSHTEIVFSLEATRWYVQPNGRSSVTARVGAGNIRLCWSASEVDKGVRFRLIGLDPARWDTIDLSAPSLEQEREMVLWCEQYVGTGYDYIGLGSFILHRSKIAKWLRIIKPDPKKMWCSEACRLFLKEFGYVKGDLAEPPHPNQLYQELTKE